ncbi:MAG: hypothetical protein MI923_29190, partial [Phycisphaerales bacterium]|nr:hypothetical protein [Phycisphaerales bacterium]
MKRIGITIIGVGVLASSASIARADLSGLSNCEFAKLLRQAIGLGPSELAAMAVSTTDCNTIAAAAETHCTTNRTTLEPLLEAVEDAMQAAFRAYELKAEDIATKDQACRDAIDALEAQCGSLLTTVYNTLDSTQETSHSRRCERPLMDVDVAMLDLTTQQRDDIRTAQRTRDKVLRHHKDRKDLPSAKQAFDDFETELASVLTTAQENARDAHLTALIDNLSRV